MSNELKGFAFLPADTFAKGPPAGADNGEGEPISANERTGPFDGQPVQGFSGVQFAPDGNGNFWFLSDNGFGTKENSADYLLRIYQVDPNFAGAENGDGSVEIQGFVRLADPDNLVPFDIINEGTEERLLTGADFDVESFVIDDNGDIWIGDEFGPYLLHFDRTGKLLEAPIPTPNITNLNTLNGQEPLVIAHRGASGLLPEHTLEAYKVAIARGADFIEPDLVSTKDGVLIARHEPTLAQVELDEAGNIKFDDRGKPILKTDTTNTTNVSELPEFADRLTVKNLDGTLVGGWFAEDFTLEEIKQLRAVQSRDYRPQEFNGAFEIPTFQEVIEMVREVEAQTGVKVGIYPETKHPTFFDLQGLSLEEPLIETLQETGFTDPNRIFIQSFEFQNLIKLQGMLDEAGLGDLPLVQLYGNATAEASPEEGFSVPYDIRYNAQQGNDLAAIYGEEFIAAAENVLSEDTLYSDLDNPEFLQVIAQKYAEGAGPWKNNILLRESLEEPVDGNEDGEAEITTQLTGEVTSFIDEAHAASLQVHPYTLRNEEQFLTLEADGTPQTPEEEVEQLIQLGADGFFTDFPETGDRVRDAIVAEQVRSPQNPNLSEDELANLARSQGFEGMAFSPDLSTLYPLLEGTVDGDPENSLRIYEFDVASSSFKGLVGYYPTTDGNAIGDFTPINDSEFLVIERDNNEGQEAEFKKIFKIDISNIDENGFVEKTEIVDLLNIQDPNDLNGDGSTTFDFPFQTIEDVVVVDENTILVANDNNYPFSTGREGDIDNNEIILIDLKEPLNLDPNLGGNALTTNNSTEVANRNTNNGNSVIFIHPDGTSPSHFAAGRFASVGPDGRLNWDEMTDAGVYLGHMDDQIVATSNGGAVVHAFGIKSHAGSYGLDEEGNPYTSLSGKEGTTIMEEAIAADKATAVINSGFIAEPGTGVFLADAEDRGNVAEITAEIVESGVNVIMGGGEIHYLPKGTVGRFGEEGIREDGRNLIEEAQEMGYTVVYSREELENLPTDADKVLGIFAAEDTYNDVPEGALQAEGLVDDDGNLIPYGQPGNENPPTVAEMLETTLDLNVFQNNENGVFVVLEEEGTDNFGNSNNGAGTVEAVLRADEAIGVAQNYIDNVNPDTLLITAADSDGGGLEIDDVEGETVGTTEIQPPFDTEIPYDGTTGKNTAPFTTGTPDANGDTFDFGIAWAGTPDFAGSIVSKTYGLNAEKLPATVDNTGIYRLMYETLFDEELAPPEGIPDGIDPAPEPTKDTGNVIFIHPDGTSPSHYGAARFVSEGPDGRLNWDEMTDAGVYLEHIDDRLVSTSNAGAVVHAYGIKPYAGSYGLDEEGNPYTSLSGKEGTTIMEEAIAAGKPTAVINSGFIAEPGTGVFLSAAENRDDVAEITADIVESGADVIMGGGEIHYLPAGTVGRFGEEGIREDGRNLIEEAEAMGYTVVYTRKELENLPADADKVLGIFAAEDTYNDTDEATLKEEGFVDENGELILYGQPGNENPPTVAEMLDKTLSFDKFANAEDGFMVVLEEEGSDNFPNNNNGAGAIEATLRADAAIGVAQDFVNNVDPNTLVLTAADSDAGGLEVIDVDEENETVGTVPVQPELAAFGDEADGIPVPLDGQTGNDTEPFVTGAPDADGDSFEFGVGYVSTSDVAGSIVSKGYGLNSDLLEDTVDNTDMYRIMYQTLFGTAPEDVADGGDDASFEPLFGTTDIDVIEIEGSNQLIFAGEGDDHIDLSQSEGGNRAFGGSGNDVFILGKSDRLVGGDDSDRFFTLEGGENLVTGDEGADQFWIAVAEIPESANTITDFESDMDVLGISGLGISFEDLNITQDGDNTLIATGENDLAILLGVEADSLSADNFAFA